MNTQQELIAKLNAFIRKYYANQLLRGGIIFLSCVLIYLILISVGEYYFYFPAWLKIIIVSILLMVGLSSLIIWVIIPFLKMQKLGKTITHHQAAEIIGKHFPQVSDKLLNVLQLSSAQSTDKNNYDLVQAAIEQKTKSLSPIPFLKAVDLRKNKKFLPFLIAPLLIIAFILFAAPNLFKVASERLIQADKNFSPPAPFEFKVLNTNNKVTLYDNYTLKVNVSGKEIPQSVSVVVDGEEIPMQSINKNNFTYTFQHVAKEMNYYLTAAGFNSKEYNLSIIEKPQLQAFEIEIIYPSYIGKANEKLKSISDLTLPQGTLVKWNLHTKNTDNVSFKIGDNNNVKLLLPVSNNNKEASFATQFKFMQDTSYAFYLSNKQMPNADSFQYRVQVIPDLNPQVQLQEMKDSVTGEQVVLTGTASDDYGISRLYFHYSVLNNQMKEVATKNIPLTITKGNITQFQYYFDFASLNVQQGQQVNYYVEAWDNDAINGSKSARSAIMTFKPFGGKSIDSAINETNDQINQSINNSTTQAEQIQNEMKDLKTQILQSQSMDWQQTQKMKSMMDQQMQLKNQVDAIKKRFEQQQKQTNQKNYSDEIKQKQDAINKQLDNLANKELADQIKKLQELMQKLNKDNAFQTMQQMEQQNKLFNMDMQRIQELMKQLEMQMKMEDMANKLQDLLNQQNQLQQKTDAKSQPNDQLSHQQDDIKKQLDQVMNKDMQDLNDKNNEQSSDNKQNLGDVKDAGKQAQNSMQQSSNQLDQNQNSKSSKSQQNAQQQMQKMMQQLRQMASGMDMQQIDIDIKATRQILSNLIRFSFSQEALMNKVKQTSPNSPVYAQNAKVQKQLADNAAMIRDSLFALSKRVYQLSATINKETTTLANSVDDAIQGLENKNIAIVVTKQQYAMTSANNLALMLNETLSNLMQMQAKAMGKGSGKSGKPMPSPGGQQSGSQMMKDIITGQQQMGKGMQQMQGQQGQNGGQQGNSQGDGGNDGNAEQIARLAQQQAMLRKQIQDLNSMLNSKGIGGNAQLLKEIQQKMNQQETDLVNRRDPSILIQRQKEIMTRMLQAEQSIREQEEDNKRSSTSGKDTKRPMPPELQQYLQSRQALLDLYKTTPPDLKPFYKKMAEDYLDKVK